jgi:hypothetical protein
MAQPFEIGGLADLIGIQFFSDRSPLAVLSSARRATPNLGPCKAFALAIGPSTEGATMTPILSTVIKSDNGTREAGRIRAYLDDLIDSSR